MCIAASLASIVIASSFVYRDIAQLLARNMAILAYISLVVISVAWSIHPDLTFRRSIGCILSILVAAYLSVRFGEKDRMKVFSFVFAISAIGSLLFVAAYPDYGIMHGGNGAAYLIIRTPWVQLWLLRSLSNCTFWSWVTGGQFGGSDC